MKTRFGVTVLVLTAAGIVAAAIWLVGFPQRTNRADPEDFQLVALGETIYRQNCASCHGANLEGQPNWRIRKPDGRLPAPPHDETGHTWHHPDDVLFKITRNGLAAYAPAGYESDMPAFGVTLTDDQIWTVLAFIKSRWPAQIRARQPSQGKGAN